jgi:hypothetical protein
MSRDTFNIPWRTVAIASLLINLGAIGTIATVATVHGENALATVALALAVIAFICQLIIFSVQTWQSGEQLKQAERLNSETSSLLAEARTRLEGTHQMVTSQYQELLHLTALKAATEGTKVAVESAQAVGEEARTVANVSVTQRVMTEFANNVVRQAEEALTDIPALPRGELPEIVTWPDAPEEAREAINLLSPLDKQSLETFVLDACYYLLTVNMDGESVTYTTQDNPLIDAGLVKKLPAGRKREQAAVQLTQKGILAARVLVPEWPPPSNLVPLTDEIRKCRDRLEGITAETLAEARDSVLGRATPPPSGWRSLRVPR